MTKGPRVLRPLFVEEKKEFDSDGPCSQPFFLYDLIGIFDVESESVQINNLIPRKEPIFPPELFWPLSLSSLTLLFARALEFHAAHP